MRNKIDTNEGVWRYDFSNDLRSARRVSVLFLSVLLCMLFAPGCGDSTESFVATSGFPGIPGFASLQATPNPATVAPGSQLQLSVTAQTATGLQIDVTADSQFQTSSSTVPEIAVSESGLVSVSESASVGDSGQVLVSWRGDQNTTLSTTVPIVVGPTRESSLTQLIISPSDPTLSLGQSQEFTVSGFFSDGSRRDVTDSGAWSSSAPSVAPSPNNGSTTALSVGETEIRAVLDSLEATSTLTVTTASLRSVEIRGGDVLSAPGGSRQFVALGTFTDGSVVDVTSQLSWTSDNDGVVVFNGPKLTPGSQGAGFAELALDLTPGTEVEIAVVDSITGESDTITLTVGSFLFVGNSLDNTLMSFVVDSMSGALSFIEEETLELDAFPVGCTISPNGKFVYVANLQANTLSGFQIDPLTGRLTELSDSPFETGAGPFQPRFDHSGRYLFLSNSNDDTVTMYSVNNDTGALTSIETVGAADGIDEEPLDIEVHPRLPLVYISNEIEATISVFSFDESGMTAITGSEFDIPGVNGANNVNIDPTGQYLYISVANNYTFGPGQIFGYRIDQETGAIIDLAGSPYDTEGFPQFQAFHPSGRFLYVGNGQGGFITVYAIDANTGELSLLQTQSTRLPGDVYSGPRDLSVDSSGRFLYVPTQSQLIVDVVQIYSIDGTTGVLTLEERAEVGDEPFGLVMSP